MDILGAGRTIYLRGTPSNVPSPHVWFILTDPDRDRVVAVMIQSVKSFTDDTLVLVAGDHPFVRHETAVQYGTANYFSVRRLLEACAQNRCTLLEDMSAGLLARVRAGLLASPRTVHAIMDYCRPLFAP